MNQTAANLLRSAMVLFALAVAPAWSATCPTEPEGLAPVHRFWSDELGGHFYTMEASEKGYVLVTV